MRLIFGIFLLILYLNPNVECTCTPDACQVVQNRELELSNGAYRYLFNQEYFLTASEKANPYKDQVCCDRCIAKPNCAGFTLIINPQNTFCRFYSVANSSLINDVNGYLIFNNGATSGLRYSVISRYNIDLSALRPFQQ